MNRGCKINKPFPGLLVYGRIIPEAERLSLKFHSCPRSFASRPIFGTIFSLGHYPPIYQPLEEVYLLNMHHHPSHKVTNILNLNKTAIVDEPYSLDTRLNFSIKARFLHFFKDFLTRLYFLPPSFSLTRPPYSWLKEYK